MSGLKGLKAAAVFVLLLTAICVVWGCKVTKSVYNNSKEENLPELIIGSDIYEPYTYINENGENTGIDVDIAREACRRIGYKPVFKQIMWDNKNEYLSSGEVDCLWGSFTMTGREEQYNWAGPYLYSRQVVVTAKDSGINCLADLEGKRVAVQVTSKPEEELLKRTNPNIPQTEIVYSMSNMKGLYASIRKRYVDAIAGHENALKVFVSSNSEQYRILDEVLGVSELGVAFAKGENDSIVEKLNQALRDMRNDGTITEIVEKYGLDANVVTGE